jgi:DNA-binding Lrp family transcriptional regulator
MKSTKRRLDRIDCEILTQLAKDARLSNKELAQRVGLAPSSALVRVQRLTEEGVLRGAHAEVDPDAMGIGLQAMIFIQIGRHGSSELEKFKAWVLTLREVMDLYYVGGSQDLLVHVAVRDTEHLRQVVAEQLSSREEVRHLETSIIFEHSRAPVWPSYLFED